MVCRQNVLKHEQDQQIVEIVEIQSKKWRSRRAESCIFGQWPDEFKLIYSISSLFCSPWRVIKKYCARD